jgi:hypothetical protein
MDIMLTWHLLVQHPFATGIIQAWKALAVSLSNSKKFDGKFMFDVQGIGEKLTKAISSAKKQPANNLLSQTCRSLGSSTERLKQSIEIKV